MANGFKFQIKRENGDKVVVTNTSEDLDMIALIKLFEQFAIACGYAQETIDQHLKD